MVNKVLVKETFNFIKKNFKMYFSQIIIPPQKEHLHSFYYLQLKLLHNCYIPFYYIFKLIKLQEKIRLSPRILLSPKSKVHIIDICIHKTSMIRQFHTSTTLQKYL